MRTTRALAVLATTVLLAAGCGGSEDVEPAEQTPEPSAGASASAGDSDVTGEQQEEAEEGVQVEVTIAGGVATPQGERVDVAPGEPVTISVTSDVADEIHVHADPEVSIDVEAGGTAEETFTIDTPGQVAVESHTLGVTIVQLVVGR